MNQVKRMSITSLCFVIGALVLGPVCTAGPEDEPEKTTPEEVLERASGFVTKAADRCVSGQDKIAENRVAKIEELIADEEPRAARRVGRQGIRRIAGVAKKCRDKIRSVCRGSARAIERLGGDEDLIEELRSRCHDQLARLGPSTRENIGEIRDALPERESEG